MILLKILWLILALVFGFVTLLMLSFKFNLKFFIYIKGFIYFLFSLFLSLLFSSFLLMIVFIFLILFEILKKPEEESERKIFRSMAKKFLDGEFSEKEIFDKLDKMAEKQSVKDRKSLKVQISVRPMGKKETDLVVFSGGRIRIEMKIPNFLINIFIKFIPSSLLFQDRFYRKIKKSESFQIDMKSIFKIINAILRQKNLFYTRIRVDAPDTEVLVKCSYKN